MYDKDTEATTVHMYSKLEIRLPSGMELVVKLGRKRLETHWNSKFTYRTLQSGTLSPGDRHNHVQIQAQRYEEGKAEL